MNMIRSVSGDYFIEMNAKTFTKPPRIAMLKVNYIAQKELVLFLFMNRKRTVIKNYKQD